MDFFNYNNNQLFAEDIAKSWQSNTVHRVISIRVKPLSAITMPLLMQQNRIKVWCAMP